ncbi:hypothetical protein FPQ18DRAFT_371457 [Pyronema domesticum]|nr:hypothetical protein FPQ18DRAFT_371457 [Pyronema domesticum]
MTAPVPTLGSFELGSAARPGLALLPPSGISAANVRHVGESEMSASQKCRHEGTERVWMRFPKLNNWYRGMYDLVPVEVNVPEYPTKPGTPAEGDRAALGALVKSRVYNPYPKGVKPCGFGSREAPQVRVFDGIPKGMPDALVGSYGELGLDDKVCFDRYGRLGSYGYGYSEKEGGLGEAVFRSTTGEEKVEGAHSVGGFPLKKIDWRGIDWGTLQTECSVSNYGRFSSSSSESTGRSEQGPKLPRTAILIRTWTGYKYTNNDIANLRSIISELSLLSGGEYTVFFLMHVKDSTPLNQKEKILSNSGLPKEFWGLVSLWNEPSMRKAYSTIPDDSAGFSHRRLPGDLGYLKLPVCGVYRSTFMPIQQFAVSHPEFDFFYNWEMDARYTGHWYHLLSQFSTWSTQQPRKGLWERNERFYIPAIHGSWQNFVADTQRRNNNTIFGPVAVPGVMINPTLPNPPDGVGEHADLITLNPLFKPDDTTWFLRNDHPGYPSPSTPRRASIVAFSRLSRRLLMAMHSENEAGRTMFSEMFPASTALIHGLKAVYVPHPIGFDRAWPLGFMEKTLQTSGRGGVFGVREHNLLSGTWYYNAEFAGRVYKAWGKGVKGNEGQEDRGERGGRMCLRGMLIHPVKD